MEAESNNRMKPAHFDFTGSTGEYFGIWIMNLLLTIVTLGIYSAWAKVRNTQYIYGHTQLDGSSFEYTAKPLDILKGRFIAAGILIGYVSFTEFWPLSQPFFLLAFFFGFPFLVVTSLRYRYHNSLYRNIRFHFKGTYGDAAREFILWPLTIALTVGISLPYIRCRQTRFIVNNSSFGNCDFSSHFQAKDFYKIFFLCVGFLILVFVVVMIAAMGVDAAIAPYLNEENKKLPGVIGLLMAVFIFYPAMGLVFLYSMAKTRNIVYNATQLESHHLVSTVKARSIIYLWFTNILAIAFTLGLAIPWTRIRMCRYYANNTQVLVNGDLSSFTQAAGRESAALGQEMADVMDIDFGL